MQQKYAENLTRNLGLGFPLLLDPDNLLARQFRLVFKLPDSLKEVYLGFGIDLERFNGNPDWELPLPGRFVIDRDGTVVDAALHPDYTHRPEPEETLEILKRLRAK
jgi:peroxiredoxin